MYYTVVKPSGFTLNRPSNSLTFTLLSLACCKNKTAEQRPSKCFNGGVSLFNLTEILKQFQ